jgi:hypothetical protein
VRPVGPGDLALDRALPRDDALDPRRRLAGAARVSALSHQPRLARDRRGRFFGTRAPARRACERPIAIACLRLLTFLPERPLRSVPRLRSRIAFATLRWAFRPYFLFAIAGFPGGFRHEYDSRRETGL